MMIDLVKAHPSDSQIELLLDEYLQELSSYREVPIGATDSTGYPYFDAYWFELGRHAYFIQNGESVAGFALVRDPDSTKSSAHEMSEFYIKPTSRCQGVGRRAALAIWQQFPGQWELQVHGRNIAATQFWMSCAKEMAAVPQVSEVKAKDGRRIQLNFNIPSAALSDSGAELGH